MIEPHVHLAVLPQSQSLVYAVLWFARGNDVLGWLAGVGQPSGQPLSRWFWLEDYYTPEGSRPSFSRSADLRGDWLSPRLGHEPAPAVAPDEAQLHALAQAQEQVVRHWLRVHEDAPLAPGSDGARVPPAQTVPSPAGLGLRPDRVNKLRQGPVWWTYDSPGADRNLLDHLSRRWPLPHRVDA